MSALALLLALFLGGAVGVTPDPVRVADEGSQAVDHGEQKLGADKIFQPLFMHLQPHAVGAFWIGGSHGFGPVKPYEVGPDGEPMHTDSHGNPELFHAPADFKQHYAAEFGGGFGFLIYNINSVQWIAGGILVVLLISIARKSKRLGTNTPRGTGYQMIEATVLYVRDEMVYNIMGKEQGRRFLPLFLTQFFFILCMNMLGLIYLGSLGGTATANIAVTGGLACTTLMWIHLSGIRQHGFLKHWKNFIPHGVPWWLLPLIIVVEILGMIVKPVALTVRLFANMTAGHLIMLSLFGLAYLASGLYFGLPAVLALLFAVAISCLELFVAFVQAYIFTYLSIIFVGASVHPEH